MVWWVGWWGRNACIAHDVPKDAGECSGAGGPSRLRYAAFRFVLPLFEHAGSGVCGNERGETEENDVEVIVHGSACSPPGRLDMNWSYHQIHKAPISIR